ncbi:MAG: NADP-dependent oxidoreductase [Candidatus Eremiobacteraeota bacterium]|nr:NADP-dependent oxidoreductase [Candidatus Eremiobacteraeota bacterium]
MQHTKGREIRLASRCERWASAENFTFAETEIAPPGPGEVVVRNTHMSVEPYMRGRMNDAKSYVPPFELGKALDGGAVGFVVASSDPSLPEGTWVHSQFGWRDYARGPVAAFQKIDTSLAPATAYLGVLGVPGFTAWVGLNVIGGLKADDVVFVSSAAGAVGAIAGQLAKIAGATVVGSASTDKVAYVRDTLHFDAAFDYRGGNVPKKLRDAAPNGITLYFDNVGGEQLEAAIGALRTFGRAAICGMISGYNEAMPGPRNMLQIIGKRLKLQGFIVLDHYNRFGDFLKEIGPAVREGRIVAPESIVDGLDNAPEAFFDMLRGGKYLGKVLVRLAPEGTTP